MEFESSGKGFLGIANPKLKDTQAIIIPFGLEHSVTYGKGTSKGPKRIIAASHQLELYDEELDYESYKAIGIRTLKSKKIPKETTKALAVLQKRVLDIVNIGKLPVVLGGEHTIAISSVKALKQKYDNFTLIHFDAHADLRDSYQNERFSHACTIRRCLENKNVNVVSLGIRSLSIEEKNFYDKNRKRIKIFWAKDKDRWKGIEKHIKGKNVYLTFDLDVFDSSLMPSTGTPEPGGIFWDQAVKLLRIIASNSNVVGVDINELAPIKNMHSCDFLTAKLCYKIISYIFHYKKDNKTR